MNENDTEQRLGQCNFFIHVLHFASHEMEADISLEVLLRQAFKNNDLCGKKSAGIDMQF